MGNYRYTSDLIADVLFRAGEPTDGTSEFADQTLTYLNRAYQDVYLGGSEIDPTVAEDWAWLRKSSPGVLTLQPPISTGSVTVTQNSASITLSSAPASSVAGYFFVVTGQPDVFKIASHTAATTTATLDSVYTGPTASGAAYTLYLTEYALASDVLRLVAPMRAYRASWGDTRTYRIFGADDSAVEDEWPRALIQSGVPTLFSLVGEQTVRFNRYGGPSSTDYIRVEYEYLYRPAELTSPGTTEEPVLPFERRKLLADVALAYLLGDKNDDRAVGTFQVAQRSLQGMVTENRRRSVVDTTRFFVIRPRPRSIWTSGPVRTSSGLIIG